MVEIAIDKIAELETLAAWHRANAEHAGSDWVWEARLRTAEDLERQAADLRTRRTARWAAAPKSARSPWSAFAAQPAYSRNK
jgi:hypothetical protein